MRILSAIMAVCCLALGCTDSTEPISDRPETTAEIRIDESSWESQIAAIRDGAGTRIAVSQATINRDQWLQLSEGCESLERLEVELADVSAADLEVLASLPNLTLLKLGAEVDDAGVASIAQIESLEFLNLPEGRFHDEALSLLADLPKLKQLRFHSPNVSNEGLRIIATFPALKQLHIISCPITAHGLRHVHSMAELQSFYLDGSDIEDEAIYELLDALPSLHFHRDQLHLPDDPRSHDHNHG